MNDAFVRQGPLTQLLSYPRWLQEVIEECATHRQRVVRHEFLHQLRAGAVPARTMQRFLTGGWPVVEQFPQYMAMNLLKVQYGSGPGHELARRYLIRNIRVEQNHVEYWIDWAEAHGIGREQLLSGWRSECADALSHWCWHTCERDPLPLAMAATNYAIEGATGEWTAFVCSSDAYANGFADRERSRAMKWLRVHAHYDDTHPWEALEIIATLVGHQPSPRERAGILSCIRRSYEYLRMIFDDCCEYEPDAVPAQPPHARRVDSAHAPATAPN
jgi:pyrroloquinoline quinone (PQQ) biosynthesis protein C